MRMPSLKHRHGKGVGSGFIFQLYKLKPSFPPKTSHSASLLNLTPETSIRSYPISSRTSVSSSPRRIYQRFATDFCPIRSRPRPRLAPWHPKMCSSKPWPPLLDQKRLPSSRFLWPEICSKSSDLKFRCRALILRPLRAMSNSSSRDSALICSYFND